MDLDHKTSPALSIDTRMRADNNQFACPASGPGVDPRIVKELLQSQGERPTRFRQLCSLVNVAERLCVKEMEDIMYPGCSDHEFPIERYANAHYADDVWNTIYAVSLNGLYADGRHDERLLLPREGPAKSYEKLRLGTELALESHQAATETCLCDLFRDLKTNGGNEENESYGVASSVESILGDGALLPNMNCPHWNYSSQSQLQSPPPPLLLPPQTLSQQTILSEPSQSSSTSSSGSSDCTERTQW